MDSFSRSGGGIAAVEAPCGVATSSNAAPAEWTARSPSLARAQRSLAAGGKAFPLWPPITAGAGSDLAVGLDYPLEIEFDLERVDAGLFDQPVEPGLDRWAPLLPPLAPGLSMGEGGTPLVRSDAVDRWTGYAGVYIKDESRNPTWSHKDRLNLCTVSGAVGAGAPGIAVASSGNHGASASAYAARAGLPCILITDEAASQSAQAFMRAYGAAVVGVPVNERLGLLKRVVAETGFVPVSSITDTHTGHPFGPEGYKTIAYELFIQLGRRPPAAVFVPTGYAELLFGVWKGFDELRRLGLIASVPRMVACEPAARGPLARAVAVQQPLARVDPQPTRAVAIACTVSSFRGVAAINNSNGIALVVSDEEVAEAKAVSGAAGLWPEFSSAAALAAVRKARNAGERFDGAIVAIQTSAGFKDPFVPEDAVPRIEPTWKALTGALAELYGIPIGVRQR